MKQNSYYEQDGTRNDERNEGANSEKFIQEISSEGAKHNKFTMRHVQHPGNTPLKIEANRYESEDSPRY